MRMRFHCLLHSSFVVSAFATEENPHNPAAKQCQRDTLVTNYANILQPTIYHTKK